MKSTFYALVMSVLLLFSAASCLQAQSDDTAPRFAELNLGGPRLGITYVYSGKILDELKRRNFGEMMSQFGWHFEYQIQPQSGGPSFLIETVPMIGGVEYGTVIPHVSLLMGIRLPNGFEIGLGPNALFTPDTVFSSLVIAIGKTFSYNDVNLPVNLAFSTSPQGARASLIFGYAIKSRKNNLRR